MEDLGGLLRAHEDCKRASRGADMVAFPSRHGDKDVIGPYLPTELRVLVSNEEGGVFCCEKIVSAWHLSSQGTCELYLSRDSSLPAYSSRLCT
jgi:hypothetical protein